MVKYDKSLKNQVMDIIKQESQGWSFTAKDFLFDCNRNVINSALSNLCKEGKIRRVARGIYDYPIYSELLNKNVASDLIQVAYAIARKFNWKILPTGDTALNYLALSTQLMAKNIYLSNGSNKKYNILGQSLEFKYEKLVDEIFNNENSFLIVLVFKTLGEDNIDKKIIDRLKLKYSKQEWVAISKDIKNRYDWIYKIICNIVKELD